MLIPIAGFPRLFVMAFFMGSFMIEIIFSINGMGQLMFTALLSRDYPIMFTVLYMQTIMGLLVHILSDFLYTVIDPRIDFEKRG
jgi:microcin C transport system permease protein